MSRLSHFLLQASARAIGKAIAAGEFTSEEVTAWFLQRISQFDSGPEGINAVRSVSPLAMDEARRADKELATGRSRSALHGVPFLVKDNVFVCNGTPTSAGSMALADFLPPFDATTVARLREAGAVLLGKTNLTEFADFVSDTMPAEFSGAGGIVRNPLGLRYGRGQGSSVGSAAAVAARFCAFAIGSETQNSIQAPAVHTSIVGFKPSVGRVSRHGIIPLVPSQDSPGALALCVEDAALIVELMAGPDMRDTATLHVDAVPAQENAPMHGLRIGIPRRAVADSIAGSAREAAFSRVLASLARAGATIIDPCDFPGAEQLAEVRSCVFRSEFKASLNALLEIHEPSGLTSLDDIIHWNLAHPESIPYGQSLLEAAHAAPDIRSDTYRLDRRRDIELSLDAGIRGALRAGTADVLLAPMSTAAKCTGKAGAPVMAIPAGKDTDGLPFGVTLIAAPGEDARLIDAARAIEELIFERLVPLL